MSPDPAGVSTSASGLTPPLRPEHLPTLTKGMDMQQNQKTVITVVGARPQFVKAGPVSRALQQEGLREIIVHTGQHYDEGMSDVFFRELGIPAPGYHLGAGGGSHGAMTGRMLEKIEEVLLKEQPDALLVYGDTNSTLAGALAAAKLHIPVAHVEAGLRSFNRRMPEELNRVCTDHLATWLYCSSDYGANQLRTEGIVNGVFVVGDVMADVFYGTQTQLEADGAFLETIRNGAGGDFDLLTIHRADTASDASKLKALLEVIGETGRAVLFPMHPRTRLLLRDAGVVVPDNIKMLEPAGYREMVAMLLLCARVITDSGGLQKEAYWARKPCITLRTETEWVETLVDGWNVLAGVDPVTVGQILRAPVVPERHPLLYGDGQAASRIASHLAKVLVQ